MIQRPELKEYPSYILRYLDLVKGGDVIKQLKEQGDETAVLLGSLSETMAMHTYEPGKWTIKEVLGHIIDTERIMAYRALCFSRKESMALPGFDQDEYVEYGNFNERKISDIVKEFVTLRASNIALFESFNQEQLLQIGSANSREVSVRALIYMIAGHEAHHINIIKEHYLP